MRYTENSLPKEALKEGNSSFETYIKVKDEWKYLYRAVDSKGNTINFLLKAKGTVKIGNPSFETDIKVKDERKYLYRTVDSKGDKSCFL